VAFHFIGGEELAIGFRFVGVPASVVRTALEARAAFDAVTKKGEARVLILTEQVSAMIAQAVMDWQVSGAYPLIVEIPDIEGHLENRASLIDSIREAVGLHV
jgi:V/A-type H+-transporting ATPase subunit F